MMDPRRIIRGARSRLRTYAGAVVRRTASAAAAARAPAAPAEPVDAPERKRIAGLARFDFDAQMASAGGFEAWHGRRRGQCRQFTQAALTDLPALRAKTPTAIAKAIAVADRLCAHEFAFLGSGPFVPVDPDRPVKPSGYRPIDWLADPPRKLRFPRKVPYKEWKLFEMRPPNGDIKYPWELSRCQHFLALAQAYTITGENRYARELADQALDYAEDNPIGLGVHWTCTMDVALRAASWCLALPLIAASPVVTPSEWGLIYRHLFETGRFIVGNLENTYEVTSNHFLSNVVGLHMLAGELGDLPAGQAWDGFARECLEREIVVQVLADGADYESSVHYHRLVAELFLGSFRLAELQGRPLSPQYRARLHGMIDFHEAILTPGGRMPVVGDADDGRLVIATGYGEWAPADGAHLLAPAGRALGETRWTAIAQADARAAWDWEAFWWGYPPPGPAAAPVSLDDATARLFPHAGLAVSRSRSRGAYLLVSNAIVGTNGFGNHKHNDLLSFEFHDRGVPLILDPGSYVYTSDFAARNAFRSTARHNTVMIDDVEQNEFRPEWLFRMFAKATPTHHAFEAGAGRMTYRGSHDGYVAQLAEGVTHTRTFRHDVSSGRLEIADLLSGGGRHRAVWHFHLAPSVEPRLDERGAAVFLVAAGHRWRLAWSNAGLSASLVETAISPSYGVSRASQAVRLAADVDLSGPFQVGFNVAREELGS